MTVQLMRDYCGDPIDDGHWVKLSALGQRQEEGYGSHWELVNEFLGYFHAGRERTCYPDLREQLSLVLNTHLSLNGAPTPTGAPAELSRHTELQLQDMGRARRRCGREDLRRELGAENDEGRALRDAQSQEAKRAWETADRERLALRVLADEQLTISEAATRINAELGYPGTLEYPPVHGPYIRYLLTKMLAAGQVDRSEETFKNKPRHRYFVKAPRADEEVA